MLEHVTARVVNAPQTHRGAGELSDSANLMPEKFAA